MTSKKIFYILILIAFQAHGQRFAEKFNQADKSFARLFYQPQNQIAKVTDYGRGYLEYLPQPILIKDSSCNQSLLKEFGFYCHCRIVCDPVVDTSKLPVIIFLHGSGERGNGGTEIWRVANQGIPKLIQNGSFNRNFIVLSPQLQTNLNGWKGNVIPFIKWVKRNYLQADTTRIYLTGLSMGGQGTWDTSYDAIDAHLAAIAPISGKGDYKPSCITAQRGTPVYCTYGDKDTGFTQSDLYNPVYGMTKCGVRWDNNFIFVTANGITTTISKYVYVKAIGAGHNAAFWDYVYSDDNLYKWLLNFHK